MAQLAIKNLSKLTPFAGGPWNLPHKFHLYLIYYSVKSLIIMIMTSLCVFDQTTFYPFNRLKKLQGEGSITQHWWFAIYNKMFFYYKKATPCWEWTYPLFVVPWVVYWKVTTICCIFWPAFGCCAPQTLVEIAMFSISSMTPRKKLLILEIKQLTSVLVQT